MFTEYFPPGEKKINQRKMNSKHMLVVQQFSQTQNETHTFQTIAFDKSLQKPPKKHKAEILTAVARTPQKF